MKELKGLEQCEKCLKSFNTTYCYTHLRVMEKDKDFICLYFVLDKGIIKKEDKN